MFLMLIFGSMTAYGLNYECSVWSNRAANCVEYLNQHPDTTCVYFYDYCRNACCNKYFEEIAGMGRIGPPYSGRHAELVSADASVPPEEIAEGLQLLRRAE